MNSTCHFQAPGPAHSGLQAWEVMDGGEIVLRISEVRR